MAYPNDIVLPGDAKKYGFIDSKYSYNPHWDIAWSFTFALTGSEHGFATFLSPDTTVSSAKGGQYLGYYDNSDSANGVLAIAFDSTGMFALPIGGNPGVSDPNVKKNSIIIRDSDNNVIFNEALSSLSPSFILSNPVKTFQTLRFRFSNAGRKLSIDFKTDTTEYTTLTSISLSFDVNTYPDLYPGFTFCSPISSASIIPSTFYLKNFHTQGNIIDPTYETIPYTPLSSVIINQYTTISGITANPPLY
jgi:hypothetical protein